MRQLNPVPSSSAPGRRHDPPAHSKRIALVLLFAMFSIAIGSAAQADVAASKQNQARQQIDTMASTSDRVAANRDPAQQDEVQIAVLTATLSLERQHNQAVLATVYWSLGVLATIAVALIGFGWLANFRIYARDKEALQQVLMAQLSDWQRKSADSVASGISEVRAEVSGLEKALNERCRELVNSLESEKFEGIDSKIAVLRRKVDDLRLELLRHSFDYLNRNHMHGNAIRAASEAALLALQMKREADALFIVSDLEKAIRKMDGLFGSDIIALTSLVDSLAATIAPSQLERLRSAISEARKLF